MLIKNLVKPSMYRKKVAQLSEKLADRYTTSQFIAHNKRTWGVDKCVEAENQILVEFTSMQPSIVASSYFANCLAKHHKANILAYGDRLKYPKKVTAVYESFNAIFLQTSLVDVQVEKVRRFEKEIRSSIKNKHDVYNLTIDGILVGDLLYDYHLRQCRVPTVNVQDCEFWKSFRTMLEKFVYWTDYFKRNKVQAINVTHCCYLTGVPLRIAISYQVPSYQINVHGAYRLSEQRLWAYTEFTAFPQKFAMLAEGEKTLGKEEAKKRLARRFAGEIGVDMDYSTKSAFTAPTKKPVLSCSKKIKILLATHCFFDSPNGLGKSLFVDFFEWLSFLGAVSEKTDYEWYIKTHPDIFPENVPIVEQFLERYEKMRLIPQETSHHQLIDEGIDFVLTVYGTVGLEYAALGVPVINASQVNPHVAYGFNLHPQTTDEYEEMLLNLKDIHLDIPIEEVYEYYYMQKIRNSMENWLIDDYQEFINRVNGTHNQYSWRTYRCILDQFEKSKHMKRLDFLTKFFMSDDYVMDEEHLA